MKKILLISLLCVGFFLRIFRLADRPMGFTWDEAALGYNAYALLQTGRDEWGQILPVVFKSFGDFKPGAYVYFTVPPVAIFGLNEFATRLSSAIFGALSIALIYCLGLRLWRPSALPAALLLAINPWAIHFSRGAWEANVALVLTVLAVLLFLRQKYYSAFLFFGLTILTYHGSKLFTPLILVALYLALKPHIKTLIKPLLLLLIIIIPILLGVFTQSGRFKVYSVFSYTRSVGTTSEILRQDQGNSWYFTIFHSELLDQFRGILQRYLNHLSPKFLFVSGDWSSARHSETYYGYFHLPELLFILLGLIYYLRHPSPLATFILLWVIVAPIPAALSRDIVSGVRALPLVVPLSLLSGAGLAKLAHHHLTSLFILGSLGFVFLLYLDLYYVHEPQFSGKDWLSAYKPAFKSLEPYLPSYDHVVFSDTLGQPYIMALFYLHLHPQIIQSTHTFTASSQGDVGSVPTMGKFTFRPLFWPSDQGLHSTLFVGNQYELPDSSIARITYPNGAPALNITAAP